MIMRRTVWIVVHYPSFIQVNVNLTAKLRREDSSHKAEENSVKVDKNNLKVGKASQSARGRRQKDDEKENAGPNVPAIQSKGSYIHRHAPFSLKGGVAKALMGLPLLVAHFGQPQESNCNSKWGR